MKETRERELKLTPRDGFQLPDLPGDPLEPRTFVSTYYDTGGRLARAGITLRRRVEDGKDAWQLKLPRNGARLELEFAAAGKRPPRELTDLIGAFVRRGRLVPVATLRTHRSGVLVKDGERAQAEVVLDAVDVLDGDAVAWSFQELEVELRDDDEAALRSIAKTLRKAGAKAGEERPKVFRVLERSVTDEPPAAPSDESPFGHVVAMLRRQRDAILAHDPGTRLGDDPEELHQFRVATRRLRALLRAASPLLDPDWARALRDELAWLGGATGPVRDHDVLIDYLRAEAASLEPEEQEALTHLFAALEEEREQARTALLEALGSKRYLDLLDTIDGELSARDADVSLVDLARSEFRKLQKAVRALGPDPSDADLHATRIRGKRARYAAEVAEPLVGKSASRFIASAKEFQDLVGGHQDAAVAEARLRELLASVDGAGAAFAVGRLVERQRARKQAARAAFARVWKRLERAGRAARL